MNRLTNKKIRSKIETEIRRRVQLFIGYPVEFLKIEFANEDSIIPDFNCTVYDPMEDAYAIVRGFLSADNLTIIQSYVRS